MEKTKILIVMQSMNVGGVERALISLMSVIPEDRYEVDLILSKKMGNFLRRIPDHVNVSEAHYKKNIKSGEGIREILSNLRVDRKYLTWMKLLFAVIIKKVMHNDKFMVKVLYQDNSQRYDYVFNFAGINTLTHLLSKNVYQSGNKYIWVHGDSDAKGFLQYADAYSFYDHVFCVSQKVTNKFKKFMPEIASRADTIYNEIDKQGIIRQGNEEHGLSRTCDETVLLTVGRLDACKGYDIAIDACSKLLKDGYKVKWYIIGEGIEREKLEAAVKQKNIEGSFILLGLKENPYPYYRTTDIYVQTSISEGYCITLAEAKAFNKPIITTDFSGADEQIINGKNGYIVPTNANEIAKSIELLICNEDTRVRFSKQLSIENNRSSFDKLEQIMNTDKNMKIKSRS